MIVLELAGDTLRVEVLVNVAGVVTAIAALILSLDTSRRRRRDREHVERRLIALERVSRPRLP